VRKGRFGIEPAKNGLGGPVGMNFPQNRSDQLVEMVKNGSDNIGIK
jgi:hypothetical protein